MAPATVVLVHGPCGSPAMWSRVAQILHDAGVPTVATHLPSSLPESPLDDASHLRAVLDQYASPLVVVGHSSGGFTITAAGDHPSVAHLVFLDGGLPEPGETLMDVLPSADVDAGLASFWRWKEGVTSVDPDTLVAYLGGLGWSSDDARDFASGFLPSRDRARVRTVTAATWRTVPNTLICCTDSGMSQRVQARYSERAANVIEMPGDHFAMWSRPTEVAEILERIATVTPVG